MYRQLPYSIEFKRPNIARLTISAFMIQILNQFKGVDNMVAFNPNTPLKLHYNADNRVSTEEIQELLDRETRIFMEFIATEYVGFLQRRGLVLPGKKLITMDQAHLAAVG